jgi:hypothetical protein
MNLTTTYRMVLYHFLSVAQLPMTKETPEGSVFMLTAGKAPEGRPRGLEIPLHNHPGGVDLLITQRFFHFST